MLLFLYNSIQFLLFQCLNQKWVRLNNLQTAKQNHQRHFSSLQFSRRCIICFFSVIDIINSKTMSSQKSVEKKPFLKRGSRQFLSSAKNRSQNYKPQIVDFGAGEEEVPSGPVMKIRSSQNVDPNYDDIKIKVGPTSAKSIPPPKNKQTSAIRSNQRPPIGSSVHQRNADLSANKNKRETSLGKKKEASLSDYLDNDSNLHDDYAAKKHTPKVQSSKKVQPRRMEQERKIPQRGSLKHTQLVQQEEDPDEEEPRVLENDSFKPFNNPIKAKQPLLPHRSSNNIPKIPTPKAQSKKKLEHSSSDRDSIEKQEVNFVSEQSDDEELPKFNQKNINAARNKHYAQQQERQEAMENQQTVSKIKMNYFNKNNDRTKATLNQQTKERVKESKKQLTINDIPKQLKEQIVKETIAQKEQQLCKQLQKLKQKFAVVKKEKEKIEEDQKAMAKARQEFQKQMEQRNREFEQKMKNENSKLTRQKKYMKDAQMSGQGNGKAKMQLQDMRKLLEKQRQEKKKVQSKYKLEIEGLRKKLTQQQSKNKLLSEQIKLLEYGQIIHKEQLQQIAKQNKKNQVQIHKIGMWADAPQSSFTSRFFEQGFSLIEMQLSQYSYDTNEYFQYYMRVKDNHAPLENQSADADRSKRQYKNGKVEIEHFQKFLKEIFPFNYTVVSLWNGDIKQTLPQGIMIYYSQNSGATQCCIKTKQVQKQIVYFPSSGTVQMKVVSTGNPNGCYNEVYCSGHLKRVMHDGTVILERKDNKGKIVSMPVNM